MRSRGVLVLAGLLVLCGCSAPEAPAPPARPSRAGSVAPAPSTEPPSTVAAPPKVVVLDPGHNGGNTGAPGVINAPVPAGRGETKPCNTTGTSSDDGYPEHAFTWDVARRVGALLAEAGVRVVYTREDDSGVGPCVDERAAVGNRAGADAVVSIHADGSRASGARGFHVSYSDPPLNDAQGEPSVALARAVREGLSSAGFPLSTYLGKQGLAPRDDLAGLNLSQRPAVLVECGNMRNAAEAAEMSTADGRAHYAAAIAEGILAYLG